MVRSLEKVPVEGELHVARAGRRGAGLGSTVLSIVPPLINNMPGMREPYGLGEDDMVVVGLIVGYPKHKYHRAVERKLAGVRYLHP